MSTNRLACKLLVIYMHLIFTGSLSRTILTFITANETKELQISERNLKKMKTKQI